MLVAGLPSPCSCPAAPGLCCQPRDRRRRPITTRRSPLAKITFPIEASHIMMFARAIGDENPAYHDAEKAKQTDAGGITVPPTFPQAIAQFDPAYHLRPQPGQPWFGQSERRRVGKE